MNLKRTTPKKILWLDLEMTGLDPTRDLILEIGAIITDWDFKELDNFEIGIKQDPVKVQELLAANEFFNGRPTETTELIDYAQKGSPLAQAEIKLLELINQHFGFEDSVLLAGNSIHMDRQFIRHYLPALERRLHYRMLDVSAWKVVMIGKFGYEFKKTETHRALSDIRESIDELKNYLQFTEVPHDNAQTA